jgi:hypothetical protein
VVTVAVAALGVFRYLRARRDPQPIRALRALHTGSANDYAAFAVVGLVALVAALRWG